MAYWDNLVVNPAYQYYVTEKNRSTAVAAHYPYYEQSSPQYVSPSPYSLAQQGYRTNTLIYACISKRLRAISSAPLWIYDVQNDQPSVIRDLPAIELLHQPNERVTEKLFWQIVSMYLDISGFSCWEIERNNMGDPIRLWPMRSDWCSFMRGNGRPLRCVRYQPYGLPYQDIPIEDVLLFQFFDPLYPLLKGYSPTMAALRDISVDNGMTEFLYEFIKQGARFSGLLTTEQDLDDIEAERIKTRWRAQHGGVSNWNDIAVLGHGTTYQNTSMNFQEMAFPELDGRVETRICMTFEIPPMLLGASIGIKASTHTNYETSRSAWYEEWVTPSWEFLAEQYASQMFRVYKSDGTYTKDKNIMAAFMTKKVVALQPDRDAAFRRAISAARANVFTRDQALEEIGANPIDNAPVYVGGKTNQFSTDGSSSDTNFENPNYVDPSIDTQTAEENASNGAMVAAQQAEKRQFRIFALKRLKEGRLNDIKSFQWKFTPIELQEQFMEELGVAS